MFMFEIGTKNYLHVDDFRYNEQMMIENSSCDVLKRITTNELNLDYLYLDTTYSDPKYTFPPQQRSVDAVNSIVRDELKSTQKKPLFIFGSYTIGKEKLWMSVAKKFNLKAYVSKDKLRIIMTFAGEEGFENIRSTLTTKVSERSEGDLECCSLRRFAPLFSPFKSNKYRTLLLTSVALNRVLV